MLFVLIAVQRDSSSSVYIDLSGISYSSCRRASRHSSIFPCLRSSAGVVIFLVSSDVVNAPNWPRRAMVHIYVTRGVLVLFFYFFVFYFLLFLYIIVISVGRVRLCCGLCLLCSGAAVRGAHVLTGFAGVPALLAFRGEARASRLLLLCFLGSVGLAGLLSVHTETFARGSVGLYDGAGIRFRLILLDSRVRGALVGSDFCRISAAGSVWLHADAGVLDISRFLNGNTRDIGKKKFYRLFDFLLEE